MTPRGLEVGLVVFLGVACLPMLQAAGDDKEPTRETATDATIEQQAQPRVLVRDLREADGEAQPYEDLEPLGAAGLLGRAYSRATLYGVPYGVYYRYGEYSSPHWLADTYRSLRYVERKERERRFNRKDMAERKERLLNQHEEALAAGLRRLKQGDTAQATVALTLAAKLNHGDPACRIHLAQARLAQGHYREAGLALRRALQLQPLLIYADLHLGRYYAEKGALDEHTDGLAKWVQENEARPEVYFLLGYLEFQRGDFEAANAAFERVREALPNDDLTREYLTITKPAKE
jgi:tetratricopeptide (TPR) repeat protein